MQAADEMDTESALRANRVYLTGLYNALHAAGELNALDPKPHKQIINRVLEPYSHISVLVTSTHWANWFALRAHPDADPVIQSLADAMYSAQKNSTPTELPDDGWHLPFISAEAHDLEHAAIKILEDHPSLGSDPDKLESEIFYMLAKVSVARCARVSYNNHDGSKPRFEKDLALFTDLMKRQPLHASPAEHQAQPDRYIGPTWEAPHFHGNFTGWRQYRKYFLNENVSDKPYTGPRFR